MDANLKIPVFSVLWKKQHGLCSKRKRKKEKKEKREKQERKKRKKNISEYDKTNTRGQINPFVTDHVTQILLKNLLKEQFYGAKISQIKNSCVCIKLKQS